MQDIATERQFYDDLFSKNPDNEHITAGYDEIHDLAFPEPPRGRILDLGCGTGAHSVRFARKGFQVVGVDLSLHGAKAARERLRRDKLTGHFLVANAEELPFRDKAFAATWGSLLLHHFPVLDKLPGEIRRITRDQFVALEPNALNFLTGFAVNIVHRIRPLAAMTPNQRALFPGKLSRELGRFGFSDFRVDYVNRSWSDGWSILRRTYRALTAWLPDKYNANKFLIRCRVSPN